MKGGTNLLDAIESLHANKFLPGSGFDLLEHEVNDLCNDLVERVKHWAPSDPRCEAYDALVLALARRTLADYGVAVESTTEAHEERDGHLDVLLAIGDTFGLLDEVVRADPSILVQRTRDRLADYRRAVRDRGMLKMQNAALHTALALAKAERDNACKLGSDQFDKLVKAGLRASRAEAERDRALRALARCRGELEACRQVMTHLKDDQTSNWLDEAARAALDDLVATLRETSAEALKLDHLDVSLLTEGDEPQGVDAQAQAEVVEVEAPEPGDQISWCHRDPDGFGHALPSDPETPSREGRWRRTEPGRTEPLDVLVRRDDAGRLWWARSFHDLHQQRFRFPVLQDGEWRGPSWRT